MRKSFTAAIVTLGLICGAAQAASPMTEGDAIRQVAWDAAECAAFYKIAMRCTIKDHPEAAALQPSFELAALIAAASGKAAGMSDDAVLAMQQLVVKQETDEMQRDCTNLPVILNKYGHCKGLLTNPGAYMQSMIGKPYPYTRSD